MIKSLLIFFVLTSVLFAQEITIAVAANVSYAIDELKAEFAKTNPETKVRVIVGGSGKLTAQIKNGAPYGLFMSANMKYPEALYNDKIAIAKPIVYAEGALAYLSMKKRDFAQGITLLEDENIHTIAVANPKTAPYGKAALEAIQNAKIYAKIQSKFVFAESISQTVSYTLTAAQIGIVAKSSLYSTKMSHFKENENWVAVNPKLYTPIKQGIVLLKYAGDSQEYRAFYDFILSEKAKNIFKRYGYIVQ